MSPHILDPTEFFNLLSEAAGIKVFGPADRACVIVRSPATYDGGVGSIIIEWQGSPPRFSIYLGDGLVVAGKLVKGERGEKTISIIRRFLESHPENEDGSPVWIEKRLGKPL